jgi:hypothetical protein
MCTSFVYRKNDVLVAMNFDNNGMKYTVNNKCKEQFTVLVDGGRGKYPSFGVNSEGVFINNLLVDSNGKGLYKRPSTRVTHTTKLVKDILDGTIAPEDINNYLHGIEIVNVPDFSCHNMICDSEGNVWAVEPGRGIIYSKAEETSYFVMSNFSLWDYKTTGALAGEGIYRYETAEKILSKAGDLDVEGAFKILEEVRQGDGDWVTAFSMVYSQKERAVYYCLNGDFKEILRYSF